MENRESGHTSFTFPGEPIIRLKEIIKVKEVIATFHLSWACCDCLAWYGSCVGPLPRCTLCSGMSHDSFAALILPIYPESGRMQMTPPCDRHFTALDGTHTPDSAASGIQHHMDEITQDAQSCNTRSRREAAAFQWDPVDTWASKATAG